MGVFPPGQPSGAELCATQDYLNYQYNFAGAASAACGTYQVGSGCMNSTCHPYCMHTPSKHAHCMITMPMAAFPVMSIMEASSVMRIAYLCGLHLCALWQTCIMLASHKGRAVVNRQLQAYADGQVKQHVRSREPCCRA